MKKTLTLGISAFCFISVLTIRSNASCLKLYEAIASSSLVVEHEDGMASPLSGSAVGALVMLEGLTPAGLVTTGVAPVGISTSDSVALYKRNHAKEILRLLNEAEIGSGLMLEQLAEGLKQQLNKSVNTDNLAKIIHEADTKNVFCPTADKLYTGNEINNYIVYQLKDK